MRDPVRDGSEVVRIWLLGGFQISVGARRTIGENDWRLKKAGSLVKLLALEPRHRMHQEQILDRLWPELGLGAATNNLRQVLHVARRALDPYSKVSSGYLRRRGELLELCPETPLWVDSEDFEEAAAAARQAGDPAAYRAAIELYTGDLLPEDLYEEWTEDRREALNRTYLSLLVELAAIYEEREEHGSAIGALQQALLKEPSHEGAHIGLMRVYALSGKRGEALGQYEQLRKALSRELGVEPSADSQRLYEDILEGRFPPVRFGEERLRQEPESPPRHNLPVVLTSFVGRERELGEVKRLLATTRLLTLTGTGGSGKTRLALEAAKDIVGAYPDGVWLVELAALSEGELVAQEVAEALGVQEQPGRSILDALVKALREKKLLLVLDNCEHLIDAAARLVEKLLRSCSGLQVLATSREALNVPGEINQPVPPLSLPDLQGPPTAEELLGYESARLLIERAWCHNPAFVLTPKNAQAVAEICLRLEGIPLAIELAAARVGTLCAEQVAARLGASLGFLTTGSRTASQKQKTLRGALDWSFKLLSEPEKRLFVRLAVFAGGYTLEAAEVVGTGEDNEEDVLDLLGKLVGKSLVVTGEIGEGKARYRMLEPVRQYAREKLEESGEAQEVLNRHAELCLTLAEQAEPELKGPQQVLWLERLTKEQDNLRAAMAWLLAHGELTMAVRLGWSLWLFWWIRGHFIEGRRWMEEVLAKSSAMPASDRAKALFVAGTMAAGQADSLTAESLLEESLGLFRKLQDKRGAAFALGSFGIAEAARKHHQRGITLLKEAADLFLEVGERWGAAIMFTFLAGAWLNQEDYLLAKRLAKQGLALSREIGDRQGTSAAVYVLAMVAQAQNDYENAKRLFEEGLTLSSMVSNDTNVAYCLEGLAAVWASEGEIVRAAEALLETIETTTYPYAPERSFYQSKIAAARAQVDERTWLAAWLEGRTMAPEQAIDYALLEKEETAPSTTTPEEPLADDKPKEKLTRREEEVAAFITQGLTNRQIASELTLSERTVDTHVSSILKKLGLRSRGRVAIWIAEQQSHKAN